ncbi:kinase-like protein [Thelephora ganbajun]|uniref:Kinase-like protein n=1 Tax=Thelephora ganbajun TaxID=370292 RepID=A0ACB6Z1M1_THEGA|nr:kinase-like protein [Thelephora ganbajun]
MLFEDPFIRELSQLDRASPQFSDQLTALLSEKTSRDHVLNLSAQDALWLAEYLDSVLADTLIPASSAFERCLCVLARICKTRKILPKSYTLPGTPLIPGSHQFASGVVTDTYKGTLNGINICVKHTRTHFTHSNEEVRVDMFYQEAIIWKHARHPNVVPFLGITSTPFQLVSKWMPDGNLIQYINAWPGANLLGLLLDIAEGLSFLHSCNIVHGDLKGPSILVDDSGRACLTDFDHATVTPDLESIEPVRERYSIRWTAPEILRGEACISKETDIYSFGMVVVEVSSGAAPFTDSTPTSIVAKVLSGEQPEQPNHPIMTDRLWALTQECLEENPRQRPEIKDVVCHLREALAIRQDIRDGVKHAPSKSRNLLFAAGIWLLNCGVSSAGGGSSWTSENPMPTEPKASPIGDLTALTAWLDALCADQNPGDLSSALRIAFAERELYSEYLSSLAPGEERAKALLEVFDKALTAPQHDMKIFKKFRQLCGRTGLLPASHIIPEGLTQTTENPVASGGFGDVWEGIYNDKRVAIKALRVYMVDNVRKVRKVFCKEVVIWRRISHPNIVPFLGVSEAPAPLSMVSEWMPNGNVREYVRKNPGTSRLQLLLDISRGLSFLHSLEIVHGDLKGDNILVDKSGCARLNDFGLTCITSLDCTETSASRFKGTYRWMAPELLRVEQSEGESGISTRQSDIFALGMVTLEVFTGQVPFPENKKLKVMMKIMDGEQPPRPQQMTKFGLSDEFWKIIQSSWAYEVYQRPPVGVFVEFLEKATPDIAVLKELTEFDANSTEHIRKFSYMFEYGNNTLLGMREDETLVLIEVFDRVLNSSLNDGQIRSRCLHGLQKVSARCGLLPKSYWIPRSSLVQQDGAFSAAGRVSKTCQRSMDGRLVVVKAISPDSVENVNSFKRRLYTDAVMWKRLRHPNVVSFLGFGSDSPFSLVYPWMPNGNLSDYLCERPGIDKLGLLLGVARGLTYLHQYNMVHGNLTAHNIMVDSDGVACISEYGLERVLRDEVSSESIPTNVRWMAPEVLSTENKNKRVASVDDGNIADVYSFAMVMFEILTGAIPFASASDEEIVGRVTMRLRPEWPSDNPSQGLVDALRDQVEACWSHDPEQRPTALMVLQSLQALSRKRSQESQEPPEQTDDSSLDVLCVHSMSGNHFANSSTRPSPVYMSAQSGPMRVLPKSRRIGVEKRVRHLLHLSKPGSTVAETVEETVIVDQREETVHISDGSISYLTSKPIPSGKKLKEVVITVVSKDQGWSSYPEDYGTYRNSWTWFELSVGSPSKDSGEKWRGEVVRNLHAHGEFKEHTIKISDGKLYEKAESGDVLTIWAHTQSSGWRNTVRKVRIRYVVG